MTNRWAPRLPASARAVAAVLWLLAAAGGLTIVIMAIVGANPAARDFWPAIVGFAFVAIDGLVAILRYRLYDIDRLISRTVGWALSTVVLVGVFVTGIGAIQALLAGVTQGQSVAVAASTLVAFALFQPVHRRVQRAVDRRFDRASYDAARLVDGFSERLRGEVELETLRDDILRVTADAVRPARAGIWLRSGVGGRQGDHGPTRS